MPQIVNAEIFEGGGGADLAPVPFDAADMGDIAAAAEDVIVALQDKTGVHLQVRAVADAA